MTELELQQYLLREYPQENARCEWKEFKNLKNSLCGAILVDVSVEQIKGYRGASPFHTTMIRQYNHQRNVL